MRALFDTNILLDIGLARKPFAAASIQCLIRLNEVGRAPCIAPHSLATFYYIVAQAKDGRQAADAVADLVAIAETLTFDQSTAQRAVELGFGDFEDAMIAATAKAAEMECIVTRNVSDFKKSPVPAVTPEEFLEQVFG